MPYPRGAPCGAETAVSRTLEPDPGNAGVGTEQGPQAARIPDTSLTWISVMTIGEIAHDAYIASRLPADPY